MIGLPLTLLMTLFLSLFFFYQRKSLTFLENSIVYMLITILTTNVMTIVKLNMKLIKVTENPLLFPAVLFYRDGIIPLLVLLFINMFYKKISLKAKFIYFMVLYTCSFGIEALLVFLHVLDYVNWNFFYSGIVHASYFFIGIGIAEMVLFVSKRSLRNDSGV